MANKLMTKYSEEMDRACPHGYYPRPSMVRDSYICLNGEWDFGTGKDEVYNEKILVPFPPESELSGIKRGLDKSGFAYYKREVKIPSEFGRGRVLLHFGAIDQEAWVYINDKLCGERLGGYIPFSFDITDYIEGDFILKVKVRDTLDLKYPYGKQTKKRGGMWYTPVSGIWQTVWLESVPEEYIKNVKITSHIDRINLEVVGGRVEKSLYIEELDRTYTFEGEEIEIGIDSPRLWTPENPELYHYTLTSGEDKISGYFALREVGTIDLDGKNVLALNGERYVFNGLLDQGYYPDGLFLPATSLGYRDDILTAKKLGYNMLRKHIKVEPEIFYYLCDTLGMAVFQDMVNNDTYSFIFDTALPTIGMQCFPDSILHTRKESREIFERTMFETVDTLYNHPSIVYYTIFNEGWGQFESELMYEKLKEYDPTRIIDSTSGWFRRNKSDVDSRHIYFKPLLPNKLDGKPLVISEFGGYSYRVEGHLYGEGNYGYSSCKSGEDFEASLIRLYEKEVLPLVESGASAFVYTQVSDVEDETNGLITYDRKVVKVDYDKFYPINSKCSGKV